MQCPNCGAVDTFDVIDTRSEQHYIRRRRLCLSCSKRFTTYETTIEELDHTTKAIKTNKLNQDIKRYAKSHSEAK